MKQEKNVRFLAAYVSPEEIEMLDRMARENDMSRSQILRRAVRLVISGEVPLKLSFNLAQK